MMRTGSPKLPEAVASVIRHVRAFLAGQGVEGDTPILIACSGGRDSVVLADSVVNAGYTNVTIAHVDHGIRSASERTADRKLVSDLARRLGVPARFRIISAGEIAEEASERGESVEAVARHRRYEELQQVVWNNEPRPVTVLLTAHHDDDVAENVLMRIFSGRSPFEPLGIEAETVINGMHVMRPLMGVTRTVISQYAAERALTWCEDRTNADHMYLRNFVRHVVLPEISARFPSVAAHLARFHRENRDIQHALAELIPEDAWGSFGSDAEWNVSRAGFTEIPRAAREMVLRRAHKTIIPGMRGSFRAVFRCAEELLGSEEPNRAQEITTISGVEVLLTEDTLTLRGCIVRPAESGYLLEVPEGECICFRPDQRPAGFGDDNISSSSAVRYLGPIVPPVVVRALRSGDRLVTGGTEKGWKRLYRSSDSQPAAGNAYVIEDVKGTVAMVRSPDEYVVRDGVSVQSTVVADERSVCVQFND